MHKANILEKIVVNIGTPFDIIIPWKTFYYDGSGRIRRRDVFKYKIRAYEALLKKLERRYDEDFISKYMDTICGRINVKFAMRRGLLTKEQYKSAKENTPLELCKSDDGGIFMD